MKLEVIQKACPVRSETARFEISQRKREPVIDPNLTMSEIEPRGCSRIARGLGAACYEEWRAVSFLGEAAAVGSFKTRSRFSYLVAIYSASAWLYLGSSQKESF